MSAPTWTKSSNKRVSTKVKDIQDSIKVNVLVRVDNVTQIYHRQQIVPVKALNGLAKIPQGLPIAAFAQIFPIGILHI